MRSRRTRRGAFTLVELLVVISIMAALMALTAILISVFAPTFKTGNVADQVTGRCLSARQMAKRDGVPTGVRFLMNPTYPTVCNEIVYVRQPDDVAQGLYLGQYTPGATPTVARIRVPASGPKLDAIVAAGDYLELYNGGVVRRINAKPVADPNQDPKTLPFFIDWQVSVNSAALGAGGVDLPDISANVPTLGVSPTNYRIIRQPQAITSEPSLVLPDGVIVDFSVPKDSKGLCWNPGGGPLSTAPISPTAAPHTEILFSPSGAVIGQGQASGVVYLWVRRAILEGGAINPPNSESKDYLAGAPRIVTIYVRSGAIAQHPVSRVTDPFEYTRDGRGSGM